MYMVILKIVTLAIEIGPAMKQSSKVELLSKIFKDVVWIDMDAHIWQCPTKYLPYGWFPGPTPYILVEM